VVGVVGTDQHQPPRRCHWSEQLGVGDWDTHSNGGFVQRLPRGASVSGRGEQIAQIAVRQIEQKDVLTVAASKAIGVR
jgi:hypothetical protein